MNTLLVLQNRAVKAAQEERWQDAQNINQEIIQQDDRNIGALNRLGFAYLQDNRRDQAQKTYEQVLTLDRANAVAKKYLDILAKQQPIVLPKALKHSDFIDEPGKTKSVQLVRLASPDVMAALSIGSDCALQATKTRVSVHCSGRQYVGSLPDDLASRIRPLLAAGNQYSTKIQSLKNNTVVIFIREVRRDESVVHITSFPTDNLGVLSLDPTELNRDEESPMYLSGAENDEGANELGSGGISEALNFNEESYDGFNDESLDDE